METVSSLSWFGSFMIIPLGLIGIVIPLVALYLIFMVYQKLTRIEQLLSQKN